MTVPHYNFEEKVQENDTNSAIDEAVLTLAKLMARSLAYKYARQDALSANDPASPDKTSKT